MRKSDEAQAPFPKSHDTQIYDTKHDEIVIWLYGKLKAEPDAVLRLSENARLKEFKDAKDVRWELPLVEVPLLQQGYRGTDMRVCGFADLGVAVNFEFKTEEEVFTRGEWVPTGRFLTKSAAFFVEVKSKVNVGETIRQVRYYRHLRSSLAWDVNTPSFWYVCAPPFAQSAILEEQGIGFIPYLPDTF